MGRRANGAKEQGKKTTNDDGWILAAANRVTFQWGYPDIHDFLNEEIDDDVPKLIVRRDLGDGSPASQQLLDDFSDVCDTESPGKRLVKESYVKRDIHDFLNEEIGDDVPKLLVRRDMGDGSLASQQLLCDFSNACDIESPGKGLVKESYVQRDIHDFLNEEIDDDVPKLIVRRDLGDGSSASQQLLDDFSDVCDTESPGNKHFRTTYVPVFKINKCFIRKWRPDDI
ncbi:hypothetical protein GWI33_019888 [Rhynchophorus ferrugineus]|uniref:Uncharacterized protein n=1 Tax=Rhynchophorus ferrugineus TaxID=354439 RepID=A0A834M4V3_RHYFE|nr:hypothetical protein GWI33_019888 [Rhynchophorus ferrugineus]